MAALLPRTLLHWQGTSPSPHLLRPPRLAEPVLAVADLVLSTLCLGGGAGATPPPFTVDALSAAPGSGAAMEDWLASVVAGGDSQEGEAGEAAAASAEDGEGEADELLVPGGCGRRRGVAQPTGIVRIQPPACQPSAGSLHPSTP